MEKYTNKELLLFYFFFHLIFGLILAILNTEGIRKRQSEIQTGENDLKERIFYVHFYLFISWPILIPEALFIGFKNATKCNQVSGEN